MSWISGRTQPLPFSTGVILRVGEPGAQAVADGRGDGVGDRAVLGPDDGGEGAAAVERRELVAADALPLVDVALVAAVGGVHADDEVGLDDLLPERVELGQRERRGAPGGRARARAG